MSHQKKMGFPAISELAIPSAPTGTLQRLHMTSWPSSASSPVRAIPSPICLSWSTSSSRPAGSSVALPSTSSAWPSPRRTATPGTTLILGHNGGVCQDPPPHPCGIVQWRNSDWSHPCQRPTGPGMIWAVLGQGKGHRDDGQKIRKGAPSKLSSPQEKSRPGREHDGPKIYVMFHARWYLQHLHNYQMIPGEAKEKLLTSTGPSSSTEWVKSTYSPSRENMPRASDRWVVPI